MSIHLLAEALYLSSLCANIEAVFCFGALAACIVYHRAKPSIDAVSQNRVL